MVAILKAREPARIMIAIGNKKDNRWHLQIAQRWVKQYNFYVNDERWGPMFVRMCPYFPFSARVCLNQHHWLARACAQEGIDFQQCTNAFLRCANPKRLQELADSLTRARSVDVRPEVAGHLHALLHRPGTQAGRLSAPTRFSPRWSTATISSSTAVPRWIEIGERLLDANRTIGQPNKITIIFGRKVTKQYRGKLQTVIEDLDLPNPVIRSHYGNGFVKQYVRDHLLLRTEPATNNVTDYGVKKASRESAPTAREDVDDHRQLPQRPAGHPGDLHRSRATAEAGPADHPAQWQTHPRPQARSSPATGAHARPGALRHIAAQALSPRREIYADTLAALEAATRNDYSLASFRYDLSKLRAKGLVEKVPRSRRYRLLPEGYSICLVFLKLFERIYAPLTAGLLQPFAGDSKLQQQKRSQLDRLYQRVVDDLDKLLIAVGLKAA